METTPLERKKGLTYSAVLHTVMLILAIFGLPRLFMPQHDAEPMAITVDILPIGEISNVKPSPKPEAKPKEKDQAKKQEAPKEKADAKNAKPTPSKQEAASTPVKPKETMDFNKIIEQKEVQKKEEKKKKVEDDLDAILKSVEKSAEKKTEATGEKAPEESSSSQSKSDTYNPDLPLSISEKDMIRSQFIKCWSVPAGARDADSLVVQLRVKVNQDGSVTDAKLAADEGRYYSDSFFRAAADSAIRAVWKCSPLQHLPPDKYSSWKDMELTFDPREMLN